MDQLDHDIVQDLLPLYHDGVCSDKSRAAVEEHLKTCEDCRAALTAMDAPLPEVEKAADDAAAVKKISREWERGKWKARMKGAGIAVLVCLLLFGGWIAATEWFVFPVELENIQITNVRQLSDGRILYHFYIDDELGLRTLGFDYVEVNGEGHMYCVPKRALYTEKRETTSLADSEQEVDLEVCGAWARASGVDEELTHIWIGQGEDAILLWEKGMDLPAASAADEAQWGFREASAAYWKAHYGGTETVP